MERRRVKSPLEIRKAADRAQHSAIERKRASGEPLLPEEEAYVGKTENTKRSTENREGQNATAMAEYVRRYPSFDVFEAAVKRAANAFPDTEKIAVEKSARSAAENEGLLKDLPDPTLHGWVVSAVIAFHSLHPEIARATTKTAYQRLMIMGS